MKRQLTQYLIDRRDAGFPLDEETPEHLQGFESFTPPAHWDHEWMSHSFRYNSVFDDISFRGLDERDYHISPDSDPPATI